MKLIQLTQGQVAKVSDEWFKELNKFKWFAKFNPCTKSFYAERHSSQLFGKRKPIKMHRVIANTPDGMVCDHIDHDTLNNLPGNLRNCTRAQNRYNSKKDADNTSGFKGVFANHGKWFAKIVIRENPIHLGTYSTPEEAARAYDEAAKKYHGKFAHLNFP